MVQKQSLRSSEDWFPSSLKVLTEYADMFDDNQGVLAGGIRLGKASELSAEKQTFPFLGVKRFENIAFSLARIRVKEI